MRRFRRRVAAVAIGATAATLAAPVGPAGAAPPEPPSAPARPGIVVENGMTQPVFSLADAVTERVWVGTRLDTDHDGVPDRVAVDISRPRETATAGLRVPVIFEQSPYRKDVWGDVPYPSVLVDELPQGAAGPSSATRTASDSPRRTVANLPGSLDDYYVPRGYAVVLGQSVGTGDSDGCPTSGDRAETDATRAVVDWLTGRAAAFDAAGAPVRADWSTGAVGMTGVSYNGTLPNMVATTGVPGLRTIVPVAAISNWYDYYRAHGLVVAPGTYQGEDADVLAKFTAGQRRAEGICADEIARITAEQDRVTGDYTAFWRDRDYVRRAGGVRASVFVVHGLNDWNVKTEHFAGWWDALARHGVPRKIWLHRGGHGGPGSAATVTLPDGRSWTYKETENRWFDHWLWNVRNGIMAEPTAVVQREDAGYATYRDWPDPAARPVALRLAAPDATAPGSLTAEAGRRAPQRQSFVDAGRDTPAAALVAAPDEASPHRLVYRTPVLTDAVRLSGRPEARLRVSVDNRPAANLTAYLVDYGPPGSTSAPVVVTRGWTDPQNRAGAARGRPLVQGREYDLRWTLEPKDHVFRAGNRIGLVVFSSDQEYTLLPPAGTRLTVTPGRSEVVLPLVGGRAALGR